ncbi:hypothetical protein LCGC14_2979310 [marine sediment metagenome]|uniref:Uncharacterized protein n=1 Tax=marine sediment metagenome TaxID=412755 RepID=A0A0F8X7Z1_9ZZZZ
MSDFEETLLDFMKRITLALEQTTRVLTAWGTARITPFPNMKVGGEKSVDLSKTPSKEGVGTDHTTTDSKPSFINTSSLAQREAQLDKTTVVESQNFVDVRECKDYSDKAYKLIGYDNLETYIAKQHVIRTESIEGGGTRVVVSQKSAWAITKLEWK